MNTFITAVCSQLIQALFHGIKSMIQGRRQGAAPPSSVWTPGPVAGGPAHAAGGYPGAHGPSMTIARQAPGAHRAAPEHDIEL